MAPAWRWAIAGGMEEGKREWEGDWRPEKKKGRAHEEKGASSAVVELAKDQLRRAAEGVMKEAFTAALQKVGVAVADTSSASEVAWQ